MGSFNKHTTERRADVVGFLNNLVTLNTATHEGVDSTKHISIKTIEYVTVENIVN